MSFNLTDIEKNLQTLVDRSLVGSLVCVDKPGKEPGSWAH